MRVCVIEEPSRGGLGTLGLSGHEGKMFSKLRGFHIYIYIYIYNVKVKVEQSRYRPGVVQRVPGS